MVDLNLPAIDETRDVWGAQINAALATLASDLGVTLVNPRVQGTSLLVDTTDGDTLTLPMPKGDPGQQGAPGGSDAATASWITSGAQTSAAIDARSIRRVKDVQGGLVPAPLRVPVAGIETMWPNRHSPYIPCWIDGNTIYAHGRDSTLRKSTDGGNTWMRLGYNGNGFGSYDCFLKTPAGTLLNVDALRNIQRSVNDGATWSTVYTFPTNTLPLGAQSWCLDPGGNIWVGQYNSAPTAEIQLLRSVDDGATFQMVGTWPGESTTAGTSNRIRHIHAVQYDPHMGRVIICTGDSTPATGLWRVNAMSDGVEPVITNAMLPDPADIDLPRSIGIMPFPDYIAWAGDTTQNPYLARMARSEIGKANPVVERVYRLNSTAWWSVKASADGSRWVISGSEEGSSAIDKLTHLYAVSDQGARVWEIGAIASGTTSAASSLQPIGVPEQSDRFHLVSRLFGAKVAYRLRLGDGATSSLPKPDLLPEVLVSQSRGTGVAVSLAPGQEVIFGRTIAGGLARRLHILESSLSIIDAGGAAAGSQRIRVRKVGTTWSAGTDQEFFNFSERYTTRQDMGTSIASRLCTGGDEIEFYLRNGSTTATTVLLGSVTFGWGLA